MNKFLPMISVAALTASVSMAEKPNVIVIMADDLGYEDLGFQGAKNIKTPNIDSLAQNGVVFTDAHVSASVCSPSRAGFMTGRCQQRFGHEANCPRGKEGMDLTEYTMGQAFKSLDYNTYLIGKWHLGGTAEQYPTARGFDEFWGLREGSRNYFYGKKGEKFGNPHSMEHNGKHVKFEGFLTDRMTDEAIRMIDSSGDKPFYMFLSYTAPHTPLQAKPEDIAKANGNKYHALIQNMDDNIGRLLKDLEDKKIRENTIIWFLSDNGGTVGFASNYPLNGKKGLKFEGGQRVPFIFNWPAKIKDGSRFNGLSSSMDIFATSFELAGGDSSKLPKKLDGVNVFPYITGAKEGSPHQTLYWRKLEGASIRDGKWKMIRTDGLPEMLYNMEEDLSELNDLAKANPEKVKELGEKLKAWETELMEPLWQEGKGFINVRKNSYIKFRDAGKVYSPLSGKGAKKEKKDKKPKAKK